MEIPVSEADKEGFYSLIRKQSGEMYNWCRDIENNIPLSIEEFTQSPSPSLCRQCRFRELCFPDCREQDRADKEF
jgi:radical SAM protein with 4Fe4S-binding SPASM domain